MKTHSQLLNNVVGQLNGVGKMMENGQDPYAVITQMKAARSALNSLMNKYIQQHFWEVMKTCEDEQEACKKFFAELISNT